MPKRKESTYKMSSTVNAEQELIALAIDQAREQLKNHTAPASTVNYYLRLAGKEAELSKRMKEAQIDVLEAKAANLNDSKGEKQAYLDAIDAIKNYRYDA